MSTSDNMPKIDFFICHASEDKENYAIPIKEELEKKGISCWLDKGEIDLGDNLIQKIQDGIIRSNYALIILSINWLNKDWPITELSNLLSRELRKKETSVIPLIIGDKDIILDIFPLLESKYYIKFESIMETAVKLSQFIQRKKTNKFITNKDEKEVELKFKIVDDLFNYIENKHISLERKNLNNQSFDIYSELFRHITIIDNEILENENLFCHVSNLILQTESKFPISVFGFPGTGKTKFLVILYLFLKDQFKQNQIDKTPIYLNLNKYDQYESRKSQELFKREFEPIKNYISDNQLNVIYIIDGFNDYFKKPNDNDESIIDLLIDDSHIKIIGSNISDDKYIVTNKHKHILNSESVILISSIDISNKYFNSFIQAYLKTKPEETVKHDTLAHILKIIKKFDITSLDLFTISLLLKKATIKTYSHCEDFSSLIEEYIQNQVNRQRVTIERLSEYAYSTFMDDGKKNISNQHLQLLLQNNFIIRDFLLANYVVLNLLENNRKDIYNQVFPYEVNKFCKQIINKNPNEERQIYYAIIKLLSDKIEIHIKTKTHFCYLLGRIKNESLGLFAIETLNKIKDEYIIHKNPNNEMLLLLRTIYISLIFLGEFDDSYSKYSDEYILRLLKSERWNNLNRGFHLEYYGDIPFNPRETDLLTHEDNLGCCDKTFNRLYTKINNYINDVLKKYSLFEVEVFTLCSLVQHRTIREEKVISDDNIMLIDLLIKNLLINGTVAISENLRKYLEMLAVNLSNSVTSIMQFALDLYHIKTNIRSGWTKEGMDITRPESIADHILGTIILAKLFLPENIKDEKDYNKNRVIDILLFHDIGEAYTTDIPSYKKGDLHRNLERKSIEYISLLSTYDNVGNLFDIEQNWKDFEVFRDSDINFRIAKDLDKLENLLQLYIYNNKYKIDQNVFDQFNKDLINRISSKPGLRILELIKSFKNNKMLHITTFESDEK